MGAEHARNMRNALELFSCIEEAGINGGCFQFVLQALGADMHLHDVINMEKYWFVSPYKYIHINGLSIQRLYKPNIEFTKKSLKEILEHNEPNASSRNLTGHLFFVFSNDKGINDHVLAVMPRRNSFRDDRRYLNKTDSYEVVDRHLKDGTALIKLSAITSYVNHLMLNVGRLEIAKIVHH